MTQLQKNWWGAHELTQNETTLKIGPLHLKLENRASELIVSWSRNQTWLNPQDDNSAGNQESSRFVSQTLRKNVTLAAALPDRSVSTKFTTPLRVLPHESIRFYLAFPLWVQVKPNNIATALDIPTWRLSNTWFGTPTEGELGYSGLLPAYFAINQLPHRSDLAITPVNIRNDGETTLIIERLSIPSDHLALYYSEDSGFWTDGITVEHTGGADLSHVRYDRHAPDEAKQARQVAAPRQGEHESMSVSRVFNALRSKGLSF